MASRLLGRKVQQRGQGVSLNFYNQEVTGNLPGRMEGGDQECLAALPRTVKESGVSVVDDGGISFKDLFGLAVKLAGDLMYLIFLAADGAAHPHPSALAMNFKLA
jgi:hypothetical protein